MVVIPALQTQEAGEAKQPEQTPLAMVVVPVVPIAVIARVRLVAGPVVRCGVIALLVGDNGIELVGGCLKFFRFGSDLVRLGSYGVFGRRRSRDHNQGRTGDECACHI
jgi:hypothetical protein